MAAKSDQQLAPLARSASHEEPRDAADQSHPLCESLNDHCQQLRMLESEVRDAQRRIDGLRREIQDVIHRGEDLLRQVASNKAGA